jgi:hypothetical protein
MPECLAGDLEKILLRGPGWGLGKFFDLQSELSRTLKNSLRRFRIK